MQAGSLALQVKHMIGQGGYAKVFFATSLDAKRNESASFAVKVPNSFCTTYKLRSKHLPHLGSST